MLIIKTLVVLFAIIISSQLYAETDIDETVRFLPNLAKPSVKLAEPKLTHERICHPDYPAKDSYLCKLIADNFPKDMVFILKSEIWTPRVLGKYKANDQGKLIRIGSKGVQLEQDICYHGKLFLKGLPIAYKLVSEDNVLCFSTKFTPFPIECIGKDNAKIWLEIIASDVQCFFLRGEGFQPNEKVRLESTSCHEALVFDLQMDTKGGLFSLFSPSVIGEDGGDGKMKIIRDNNETLALEYEWGSKALRHINP